MSEKPSFFAELKRRNVYKVAIAYSVVGWLLIQVATQVFPFFEIPNWVVRLVVLLILLGFPIALVIAWAFELTPEGLKRTETADAEPQLRRRRKVVWMYVVLIAGASAIGLFSIQHFTGWNNPAKAVPQSSQKSNTQPVATLAKQPIDQKSIAVLPFDDLSPAHDQANFSDGMAEEILNALTRIRALKVIARSSSFQFKGKEISPQQIGAELGVAHVLEGSVRKQSEELRITATLVQTSDGVQQWSNTYNGQLSDVFKLQESCAHDIADQLNVVLGDDGKQRLVDKTTDNAEAYALFVEAQTLVNARVGDSLPRAIAKLEKVTALDPKFARAWSKLAVAHAVLPQYVGGDWATNLTIAESDAQRAIALDPDNAEAYAALGYIAFSRRRYVEMVEPAERALALDPNDETANFWASNELAAMGRTAEAESLLDHALIRDPASARAVYYKGLMRWRAGDVTTAARLAERSVALGYTVGGATLSFIAATNGDYDRGAPEFARGLLAIGAKFSSTQLQTIYRGMYLGATEHAAALAVIATHKNEQYVPTFLLMLGEPERSFAEYEQSATGLSDAYLNFLWQPDAWSRKARQSPAFQGFAKRLGMVDYWKQNRWPDLCSPTPENPDAFTCR
ncbi:MAG: tetratricopeptide repeat protein [Chthoniobacterales bacterium]